MLGFLRRTALRKGILRGNRLWMVIGFLVWGLRAIQWAWPKEESVVYRTVLQPGETLEIVHDLHTQAERRRAGRRKG